MENSDRSSYRWWEFYAIRYAMGSVVGGIIVFILCRSIPAFKPFLFQAASGKIDVALLILLAAYGLTYCYIASAPILVFHAARFLLVFSGKGRWRLFWDDCWLLCPPFASALAFFFLCGLTGSPRLFYSAIFYALSMLMWMQYLFVFRILRDPEALYSFYHQLANKRRQAQNDIVESYRHLREHGNSFLIVFFEIALAVLFYCGTNFHLLTRTPLTGDSGYNLLLYVALVILWVLPAAGIWFVGTALEWQFYEQD